MYHVSSLDNEVVLSSETNVYLCILIFIFDRFFLENIMADHLSSQASSFACVPVDLRWLTVLQH